MMTVPVVVVRHVLHLPRRGQSLIGGSCLASCSSRKARSKSRRSQLVWSLSAPLFFFLFGYCLFFEYSKGMSIPTLLAVNRILSSSSMFIPGLYRSIRSTYFRCERRYAMSCSAWAAWLSRAEASADETEEEEEALKVVRRLACRWERGEARMGRGGSSRRRER